MAARNVHFALHPDQYLSLQKGQLSLTDPRYVDLMERAAGFEKVKPLQLMNLESTDLDKCTDSDYERYAKVFQKRDFSIWTRIKLFFSCCKEAIKTRWATRSFFLNERKHSNIVVRETLKYENATFYAKCPKFSSEKIDELFGETANKYFEDRGKLESATVFRSLELLLEFVDLDQDAAVEQLYSNRPRLNKLEEALLIEAATVGGKDRVVQALLQGNADKDLDEYIEALKVRLAARPETWRPHQAIPLFDAILKSGLDEKVKIQQVMNLICEGGKHNKRLGPMFIAIANAGRADLICALYNAGLQVAWGEVDNAEGDIKQMIPSQDCHKALLAACKRGDKQVVEAICGYESQDKVTFASQVITPILSELRHDKRISGEIKSTLILKKEI